MTANKGSNMGTMIDVYVRPSFEDIDDGIYLGAIPLTACQDFARYFMETRPWIKGDGWGTGGGHFVGPAGSDGWRFEIVLDKPA